MSYSINGKVYTDHPLMDEVVHNCKNILRGIIIKNDVKAAEYETQESIDNSELYIMIKEGTISFDTFQFTRHMFISYGFSPELTNQCMTNRYNVPESKRESLLEFCINYFLDNFEEKNNYYRMLMGLPNYGTDEYNIYIDSTYIPSNYKKEVDFTKPIHEFDDSLIAILYNTGKIDKLRELYPGSKYSYIKFLGDRSIDLYTARKAQKWDILYMPSVESLVEERFKELYTVNRDIYLKRTYQDAYALSSNYYEEIMIFMVLSQTFNDMIIDVPEWYIRRDIFDIRSVQYFLESYGVKFFKQIPLKYQIRIVKNLNKLIKYKSSNQNNFDILDIFSTKETSIFKYYLYKKRNIDGTGYVESGNILDQYSLEFVQSKLGDSYDNYIKDNIYRRPYDELTYDDVYWDGEDSHDVVKMKHLERDFTIEPTKYMSIEFKVSMTEYYFQMQYFLGLLLDSKVDMDDIKINIPSIESSTPFKLTDLFIFLFLMSTGYENCDPKILRPEKASSYNVGESGNSDTIITPPDYDHPYESKGFKDHEKYYDWMDDRQYKEMRIDTKDRVYGFNKDANMILLNILVNRRHSRYQFDRGFSLDELGVDKFSMPDKISTINELVDVYKNNKQCYDNLKVKLTEEVNNNDDRKLMDYVFNYLFTKTFDYGFYTLSNGKEATSLSEILEDRDYILYSLYLRAMSETNDESRKDTIRGIMNDVISTLEYYLSDDGLNYVLSFATTSSFSSMVNYIYLMINFFKSYKVHFLDPFITFYLDDKLENSVIAHDTIAERRIEYVKGDTSFYRDTHNINIHKYIEDNAGAENNIKEVLDIYGHFEADPNDDYDYDGMYPDSSGDHKDANGGYPADKFCIPYFMLNGGSPQGSNIDIWNLDGASPSEMENYIEVDGGYTLNKDDFNNSNSYWANAFNYIVDGGSAGTNQFISKSMHVRVIDGQISSDVKISKYTGNILVTKEDGLYLEESWVSWTDFEELEKDSKLAYDYYSSVYNNLSEIININSDELLLEEKIEHCINKYMANIRKVINYMTDDAFEQSLKDYTDEHIEKLYDIFNGFYSSIWSEF